MLAIDSPVGGGGHGQWGMIAHDATYLTEAGVPWSIPALAGIYPIFPQGSTDEDKRRIINMISSKLGIKITKIGKIQSKSIKSSIIDKNNELITLKNKGYFHRF